MTRLRFQQQVLHFLFMLRVLKASVEAVNSIYQRITHNYLIFSSSLPHIFVIITSYLFVADWNSGCNEQLTTTSQVAASTYINSHEKSVRGREKRAWRCRITSQLPHNWFLTNYVIFSGNRRVTDRYLGCSYGYKEHNGLRILNSHHTSISAMHALMIAHAYYYY